MDIRETAPLIPAYDLAKLWIWEELELFCPNQVPRLSAPKG